MRRYLFACVENAGRSQMAAAFFNLLADPEQAQAISAGTRPGQHVHLEVVDAMHEVGVDLASVQPQRLTPELANGVSLLVTMGCGEECPFLPGVRVEDWPLQNPRGQLPAVVREIRDEIRSRVEDLIRRDGLATSDSRLTTRD